jgi:hypothetical protein
MKTKIAYRYCDKEHVIDVSNNENILSLLKNDIYTDKEKCFTHPKNEADDKIRKFVDEELKKQPFYHGTGHAEEFFIYKTSDEDDFIEKLHVIHGSFSDESIQEIIREIKKEESI